MRARPACSQQGCPFDAEYRFTWPGQDESGICAQHAPKLKAVAQALGMHLQLIPLSDDTEANK